jgi:acyl-coenzyme A thioesterase PaaI-like protein
MPPRLNERMRSRFVRDEVSDAQVDHEAAVVGPLAQAVRGLVDAVIRTEVDDAEIEAVRREVEALTARLRARELDGSYGTRLSATGRVRNWGNAVIGVRNAVAPPLDIERADGRIRSDFVLGAAYEGPPGLVHGGVAALVLDQALGEAAAAGGRPGMTGTLTLRYREATPLGALRVEAEIDRVEGVKTFARGRLLARHDDGSEPTVCVEAEGVFILPRWARGRAEDAAATVDAI